MHQSRQICCEQIQDQHLVSSPDQNNQDNQNAQNKAIKLQNILILSLFCWYNYVYLNNENFDIKNLDLTFNNPAELIIKLLDNKTDNKTDNKSGNKSENNIRLVSGEEFRFYPRQL